MPGEVSPAPPPLPPPPPPISTLPPPIFVGKAPPPTREDEERQRLKEQKRLWEELQELQKDSRDYLIHLLTERKKSLKRIMREVVKEEKIYLEYISEIENAFFEYKKAAESSKIKIEEKCDELKKLLSESLPKVKKGDYQAAIDAMWINIGSALQSAKERFSVRKQKALQKNQLQQEKVQDIIEALEENCLYESRTQRGRRTRTRKKYFLTL